MIALGTLISGRSPRCTPENRSGLGRSHDQAIVIDQVELRQCTGGKCGMEGGMDGGSLGWGFGGGRRRSEGWLDGGHAG